MNFRLRPTLFGSQIEGVWEVIRTGCAEHGKTRAGVPECYACGVLEAWEDELTVPKGSYSTASGYVETIRAANGLVEPKSRPRVSILPT